MKIISKIKRLIIGDEWYFGKGEAYKDITIAILCKKSGYSERVLAGIMLDGWNDKDLEKEGFEYWNRVIKIVSDALKKRKENADS